MNAETLPTYAAAILRHVLQAIGAILVTRGLLGEGDAEIITGAVMSVAPIVWSLAQKRIANTKLQKAIKAPAGKKE